VSVKKLVVFNIVQIAANIVHGLIQFIPHARYMPDFKKYYLNRGTFMVIIVVSVIVTLVLVLISKKSNKACKTEQQTQSTLVEIPVVEQEGGRRNMDEIFCESCGAVIKKDAEICPKCGVRNRMPLAVNWLTCLLLCIFLGMIGAHRFYTKKTGTAILMLLTGGVFGIMWLIDLIMIICGKFTDVHGNVITNNS
jgi:TM2 domain-containing membrane protein YozV